MSEENPFEGIVDKTRDLLEHLLPIINEGKVESAKRYGGFLIAGKFDKGETVTHLMLKFGDVPESELPNYQKWAMGKVQSLQENPDHVSSRQSRNPDLDRWGGAIRAGEYFLSFSGFEEDEDEALVLLLAIELSLLGGSRALEIVHYSKSIYICNRVLIK